MDVHTHYGLQRRDDDASGVSSIEREESFNERGEPEW